MFRLSVALLLLLPRWMWRVIASCEFAKSRSVIKSVNKPILIPTNTEMHAYIRRRVSLHFNDQPSNSTTNSLRTIYSMSSLQNRPYSRPSMLDPTTPHSSSTNQPPARFLPPHILTSRIAEKQAEFQSLSQLRDLSAGLAAQMESLESKLNCLADGTESTYPSKWEIDV